jgi:hypothetical protein
MPPSGPSSQRVASWSVADMLTVSVTGESAGLLRGGRAYLPFGFTAVPSGIYSAYSTGGLFYICGARTWQVLSDMQERGGTVRRDSDKVGSTR